MPFSLLDQTKPKQAPKNFWKRRPVLVPVFLTFLLSFAYTVSNYEQHGPVIGIVPIDGVIVESEWIIRDLRKMEKNDRVKGIIIRVNSPGGAVAPSQEVFQEVRRLSHVVPIYCSISTVAASGGYYIALGAEKIFANPGSLTGSIGVIMQTYNVGPLMDKIGIKSQVVKSGQNKDIGSPYRPMEAEERKLLETVLKSTHEQFISAVADMRPLERPEVEALADGRVFTGEQALNFKLVDGLLSFREVVEQMQEDTGFPDAKPYYIQAPEDTILERLGLDSLTRLKETVQAQTARGLFYLAPGF